MEHKQKHSEDTFPLGHTPTPARTRRHAQFAIAYFAAKVLGLCHKFSSHSSSICGAGLERCARRFRALLIIAYDFEVISYDLTGIINKQSKRGELLVTGDSSQCHAGIEAQLKTIISSI